MHWPDHSPGHPTGGILDRCVARNTLPEDRRTLRRGRGLGSEADVGMVGTRAAKETISCCRITSADTISRAARTARRRRLQRHSRDIPDCSSTNYGPRTFPAIHCRRRKPSTARFHFRNWVMNGTPPPPSRLPDVVRRTLSASSDYEGSDGLSGHSAILASSNPVRRRTTSRDRADSSRRCCNTI